MTKDNSQSNKPVEQKAANQSAAKSDQNAKVPEVKVQQSNLKNLKVKDSKRSSDNKKNSVSAKERSKSWYYNRYQIVAVQRNILLIFSIFSIIAVAVCVVFVQSVTSSKSLEPYVIEIEEKTGIPVVVDQQTIKRYSSNDMVVRYFLNQYIHAASGFNSRTYKLDALKVRLMSTANVYSQFRRRVRPRDFAFGTRIQVRIKSIQFPAKKMAQVRILRVVSSKEKTESFNEIINMEYKFSDLRLNSEERMVNPLGFVVGRYLVSEEVYEY